MNKASDGDSVAAQLIYRHPLLAAISPMVGKRSTDPKRRGGWTELAITLCSILMAWSEASTLLDRFSNACELAGALKADTYTGFSLARRRLGVMLVGRVRASLAARLQDIPAGLWTTRGWCVFAIDGSKFDAPRTADNETAMGVTACDRAGPQMLATILVHLGSCVLWNWRIGKGHGSERAHLSRLIASTPSNALLVADAGFMGFDCLREVVDAGRHVLVRLAGNARLIAGLDDRNMTTDSWPKSTTENTDLTHGVAWHRLSTRSTTHSLEQQNHQSQQRPIVQKVSRHRCNKRPTPLTHHRKVEPERNQRRRKQRTIVMHERK